MLNISNNMNSVSYLSRCSVVIHFFEGASKVGVKEDSCDDCGANNVEVAFKVHRIFE